MQNLINISPERLQQIEREREETMADSSFIQWFREMRIASRQPKQQVTTDRHHFNTEKIDFKFKF